MVGFWTRRFDKVAWDTPDSPDVIWKETESRCKIKVWDGT